MNMLRNLLFASLILGSCNLAFSQILVNPVINGVGLSENGALSARHEDATLAAKRAAARSANQTQGLAFVSLPRALDALRANVEQKQPIPENLKYLGGLTRIRFVYLYPEQKDIILAGPSEAIDATNPLTPVGKSTGHPILQLEDLVVVLRAVSSAKSDFFGCSLDSLPNTQKTSDDVVKKFGNGPREKLIAEMKKAMGPQTVRIFGVPEDSRAAFVMLAADYRLKSLSMGAEPAPIDGLASAVNDAAAASRLWFETSYEPLLVSENADAFEIRGSRVRVNCGAQNFEPKGASEAAQRFAKTFTEKMPALAEKIDAFADLQNISDLLFVAALIKHDKLDQKTGIDLAWALDATKFKPAALPIPKTADTLVHISGKAIASGGVGLGYNSAIATDHRQTDTVKTLEQSKNRSPENWLLTTSPAAAKK